jgi:hypothetical protein
MPRIEIIDPETDLPIEVAEKIKRRLKTLEDENARLRAENDELRRRIDEIEAGALGIRKVLDENGGRIELAPGGEFITQLTDDGTLRPIQSNILKIGDDDAYLNNVITANITVASSMEDKEDITDVDFSNVTLPAPKKYRRVGGVEGEEVFFLAEEMPDILRKNGGIDLKALVAFLAWKMRQIEQKLEDLRRMKQ